MTGRTAEAVEVESLLKANQDLVDRVGGRIYRSRISPTSADDGSDIRIYCPRARGEVDRGEQMPEFDTDITLHIEVRVVGVDQWDLEAETLTGLVMSSLYNNDIWLQRFEDVPSWDVSQFKDGQGEHDVVGEMITLQLSPVKTLSFGPTHEGEISGVTIQMVDEDDEIIVEQEITS